MKFIHLVRQTEFSDPFIAFPDYESAYQVARKLTESKDGTGVLKLVVTVPYFPNENDPIGIVLDTPNPDEQVA